MAIQWCAVGRADSRFGFPATKQDGPGSLLPATSGKNGELTVVTGGGWNRSGKGKKEALRGKQGRQEVE